MEEILYELRHHCAGLNAGRWDYLFSIVKKFRDRGPAWVLPDRSELTMTTPFMQACTDLLVSTCHRRGAHAIGAMSTAVPDDRDPAATRDFPAYCQETGHELVSVSEAAGVYRFELRKRAEPA